MARYSGDAMEPFITRDSRFLIFNFDVEVSADGSRLYISDGVFTGGAVPVAADIAVAVRTDAEFRRVDNGEMAAINTSALEYADSSLSESLAAFDSARLRIDLEMSTSPC